MPKKKKIVRRSATLAQVAKLEAAYLDQLQAIAYWKSAFELGERKNKSLMEKHKALNLEVLELRVKLAQMQLNKYIAKVTKEKPPYVIATQGHSFIHESYKDNQPSGAEYGPIDKASNPYWRSVDRTSVEQDKSN